MVKRSAIAGPTRKDGPVAGSFTAPAASPLDAAIRQAFGLSWGQSRRLVEQGKVTVEGGRVLSPTFRLRPGALVAVDPTARRIDAGGLPPGALVYVDAHVVVVRKPPGISTVPFDDGERGTLDELVRRALAKSSSSSRGGPAPSLGVVHRLDKETSGLVVFTRTWLAKQSLASQFRAHTVLRRYLGIAHGRVPAARIESHLVADRGDGLRGSLEKMPARFRAGREGQRAVTHVEPLAALREGDVEGADAEGRTATLIACRLETGRTHQIRIHLAEMGHPLLGERVYVRELGAERSSALPAPRVMLHAETLGFVHPKTEQLVQWSDPPPEDFASVLRRLGGTPSEAVSPPARTTSRRSRERR